MKAKQYFTIKVQLTLLASVLFCPFFTGAEADILYFGFNCGVTQQCVIIFHPKAKMREKKIKQDFPD